MGWLLGEDPRQDSLSPAAGAAERRLRVITIRVFCIAPAAKPDDFPSSCIALTKAYQARREAKPKFLYTNAPPFCRDKVTKFMLKHAYPKNPESCHQKPDIHENFLWYDTSS